MIARKVALHLLIEVPNTHVISGVMNAVLPSRHGVGFQLLVQMESVGQCSGTESYQMVLLVKPAVLHTTTRDSDEAIDQSGGNCDSEPQPRRQSS